MYATIRDPTGGYTNVALEDPLYFQKSSKCFKLGFLDMEKTNVATFLPVLLFIFVLPMFACILLLVDSVRPLHGLFTDEQAAELSAALTKTFILIVICTISFIEIFAILDRMFVAFVLTELILWISFVFGFSHLPEEHRLAIFVMSGCILLKIIIGIILRKQFKKWMQSKAFATGSGKKV